jgi:hypothetical protein
MRREIKKLSGRPPWLTLFLSRSNAPRIQQWAYCWLSKSKYLSLFTRRENPGGFIANLSISRQKKEGEQLEWTKFLILYKKVRRKRESGRMKDSGERKMNKDASFESWVRRGNGENSFNVQFTLWSMKDPIPYIFLSGGRNGLSLRN